MNEQWDTMVDAEGGEEGCREGYKEMVGKKVRNGKDGQKAHREAGRNYTGRWRKRQKSPDWELA